MSFLGAPGYDRIDVYFWGWLLAAVGDVGIGIIAMDGGMAEWVE